MDGVIVDLRSVIETALEDKTSRNYRRYRDYQDNIPGIFRNPKPIEGAIDAVWKLEKSGKYDLYIATAAPWGNPYAATDKRFWIEEYFGDLFSRKMAVTHMKNLLIGDYLIDDRLMNGAGEFGQIANRGIHIHFGSEKFPDWDAVLKYLL